MILFGAPKLERPFQIPVVYVESVDGLKTIWQVTIISSCSRVFKVVAVVADTLGTCELAGERDSITAITVPAYSRAGIAMCLMECHASPLTLPMLRQIYMISEMIFDFSISDFGHPKFLKSQFGHPVMNSLVKVPECHGYIFQNNPKWFFLLFNCPKGMIPAWTITNQNQTKSFSIKLYA